MHSDKHLFEISRLVLDLTALGSLDNDLDNLLAKFLGVLKKLPGFEILQRGAIRMLTPRGRMLTVAQYGFRPVWLDATTDAQFAAMPTDTPHTVVVSSPDDTEQYLLLPLTSDATSIGQALIGIAPDWHPSETDIEFMNDLSQALSGLVTRCIVHETLKVREIELEEARTQAIRRLGSASEYRDNETGMHIMRMTSIAVVVAKALGLSDEQRELLFITAPMHDVGKIGIADAILLKPGKLSSEEFAVMQTHTEIGERLLHGDDPLIKAARDIAAAHHENWDGSGYPRGLRGDEIPILARICSIADVFDALTSQRPYKEPWSPSDAVEWIVAQSGSKFDPKVVHAFEQSLPQILRIRELYREEIIDPHQVLDLPDLKYSGRQWITWDASLVIGIQVIDEHHRYLFDLVNDLITVVANKLGAREVGRVLKSLEQYARIHFRAEERMMEHYGYNGLERQQQQHTVFCERLREFAGELNSNPLVAQFEIITYLREWLVAHIRLEDAQLKSLVRQSA